MYLVLSSLQNHDRITLDAFEREFLCQKFTDTIYEDFKITFLQTADIMMFEGKKIDECVNEYTDIIIKLIHGEVYKRIHHTIGKIKKRFFTFDITESHNLIDFDEIIFEHYIRLVDSIHRFFDDCTIPIPFTRAYMFSNTISPKFEWYPCYNNKIVQTLQKLHDEIKIKRSIIEKDIKVNEKINEALTKLELKEFEILRQEVHVNQMKHILETKKCLNKFQKFLCINKFPKKEKEMDNKMLSKCYKKNFVDKYLHYKRYWWRFTKWILKSGKYGSRFLGFESIKADQSVNIKKIFQLLYKKEYQKDSGGELNVSTLQNRFNLIWDPDLVKEEEPLAELAYDDPDTHDETDALAELGYKALIVDQNIKK